MTKGFWSAVTAIVTAAEPATDSDPGCGSARDSGGGGGGGGDD